MGVGNNRTFSHPLRFNYGRPFYVVDVPPTAKQCLCSFSCFFFHCRDRPAVISAIVVFVALVLLYNTGIILGCHPQFFHWAKNHKISYLLCFKSRTAAEDVSI